MKLRLVQKKFREGIRLDAFDGERLVYGVDYTGNGYQYAKQALVSLLDQKLGQGNYQLEKENHMNLTKEEAYYLLKLMEDYSKKENYMSLAINKKNSEYQALEAKLKAYT